MGLFVLKPVDLSGPGLLLRGIRAKIEEESFRGKKVDNLGKNPDCRKIKFEYREPSFHFLR